jgi:hypothetical protein
MLDGRAGHPIKKDPRGCGNKQGHHPIPKAWRKTAFLEEVNNIVPTHGVERFSDVKLEKKGRRFSLVKPRSKILDIEEVIMNAPFLDESTLRLRDKVIHMRCKP